ncbi:MAG TPA: sulfatase-like hydrolase/transferase [Kiloniellales bacterium]|nr:sulfatase-like hydrolase/transferase [Kiloniellales bacterium]
MNVLLITTDQQRGDCFGGERRVRTPNLDALAARGTRFAACIAPNLVCQPARASILTGLLPLTHGVRDNGIDLPETIGARGFAQRLADAGWATRFVGKAHFSTQTLFEGESGRPENKQSSRHFGERWRGPYMGFQEVELLCFGHSLFRLLEPPYGLHYEHWFFADGRGPEKLELYKEGSPTPDRATLPFHSHLPVEAHTSSWVADRTIALLRERPRDRPLCLWASFPDPHYPFDCPEPWASLHPEAAVELPRHRTLDLERRPWWHRAFVERRSDSALEIGDYGFSFLTVRPGEEALLRAMTANYFGMIALADHAIGRILQALRDEGIADDTLVLVTSDHGDFLGDHGLLLKGPCAYEGLLRVGLIAAGPGVAAGQVVREPVSTLDIAPTVLERAGLAAPLHGRSLNALLAGCAETRDGAIMEWDMAFLDREEELRLRTVRTARWVLTLELNSGAGELYDLREDPEQMDNVFTERPAVVRELTEVLRQRPCDESAPLPRVGLA